jgi:hypothetical protein
MGWYTRLSVWNIVQQHTVQHRTDTDITTPLALEALAPLALVVQQHSSTAAQHHSTTAAQQYSSTAVQQHSTTAAQQYSSTAVQQHSSTAHTLLATLMPSASLLSACSSILYGRHTT